MHQWVHILLYLLEMTLAVTHANTEYLVRQKERITMFEFMLIILVGIQLSVVFLHQPFCLPRLPQNHLTYRVDLQIKLYEDPHVQKRSGFLSVELVVVKLENDNGHQMFLSDESITMPRVNVVGHVNSIYTERVLLLDQVVPLCHIFFEQIIAMVQY